MLDSWELNDSEGLIIIITNEFIIQTTVEGFRIKINLVINVFESL